MEMVIAMEWTFVYVIKDGRDQDVIMVSRFDLFYIVSKVQRFPNYNGKWILQFLYLHLKNSFISQLLHRNNLKSNTPRYEYS